MKFRSIGQSKQKISEIGIGTEYLIKQPRDVIIKTIRTAVQKDIIYFDILFHNPQFLTTFSEAIEVKRNKLFLAVHIGAGEINEKHQKIRNPQRAKSAFKKVLSLLQTDYVDVAIVQNLVAREYDKVMNPSNSILEFATELRETQQAKFLGISIHDPILARKAVETRKFDLIMSQLNLFCEFQPERKKLLALCRQEKVGVVAIKPFAGGNLLKSNRKVRVSGYKSGGQTYEFKMPKLENLPSKCLSYVLNNYDEVSTVVPGVKNIVELEKLLEYYSLNTEQLDYQPVLEKIGAIRTS